MKALTQSRTVVVTILETNYGEIYDFGVVALGGSDEVPSWVDLEIIRAMLEEEWGESLKEGDEYTVELTREYGRTSYHAEKLYEGEGNE